jgi:hypothetical protein
MPPFQTAKDIAQAPAEYHAECHVDQQVIDFLQSERRRVVPPDLRTAQKPADIKPAEQQSGEIGEAIPFDGKRSELGNGPQGAKRPEGQSDGIEIRKRNGDGDHDFGPG